MIAGVVLAVLGSSLPAAAAGGDARVDLVGVRLWASSLDVVGLDEADAAAVKSLWGEFVSGLPEQAGCLIAHPPTVEVKADMAPRAAYAPSISTLYVRPGDLDRLVVFHELAHHLDFTCGAADQIGAEFRQAQGIADSKPWWKHGSPVSWPAEYFANAVAISLGESSRHAVAPAAVEVVERWTGRAVVPTTVKAPPPTIELGTAAIPGVA